MKSNKQKGMFGILCIFMVLLVFYAGSFIIDPITQAHFNETLTIFVTAFIYVFGFIGKILFFAYAFIGDRLDEYTYALIGFIEIIVLLFLFAISKNPV